MATCCLRLKDHAGEAVYGGTAATFANVILSGHGNRLALYIGACLQMLVMHLSQ